MATMASRDEQQTNHVILGFTAAVVHILEQPPSTKLTSVQKCYYPRTTEMLAGKPVNTLRTGLQK